MKVTDLSVRRLMLAQTQMFQSLQPQELDLVSARAAVRRVRRNEVILRRGDPNGGMIIIMTGRVRISVVSEDGKEVTLSILDSGQVPGEMSLLDGDPCSTDVIAHEDCVVLVIDRRQFLTLLNSNAGICLHLLKVLTRKLRRSNVSLEDIATLDLPTRLSRVLARLADDYGVPIQSGTRIDLRLSQRDLSTLVGASRQKVNRQLRQWEEEGTLSRDSGYLVVTETPVLTPCARSHWPGADRGSLAPAP